MSDSEKEVEKKEKSEEETSDKEDKEDTFEEESDADNRTEDDPLSDVWDSDDPDLTDDSVGEDKQEAGIKHNYAKVQMKSGLRKIDITPPEQLLIEAQRNVKDFYKKKMADECIKEGVRCLSLSMIVDHYDKPWILAKHHAAIAKAYWQLKEYPPQTEEHAKKALKYLSMPLIGKEQPEKAETLETALQATYLYGKSLLATKKYVEAEHQFLNAENILNERKRLTKMKDKDFWTTELYTALARIKLHQQQIGSSISYLEKVKKLMIRRYGEDSVKLIPIYQELSKMEQGRGSEADYELAVDLCAKAHAIAETNFEENNPQKADAAFALAMAHSIEKSEEAEIYTESYLNEAIGQYETSLGRTHSKTLKAQQTLAKQLAARNRQQEAVVLLDALLPHVVEDIGVESYQRAQVEKLLATFCLQSGESSKAKKHLKECLRIETARYGGNASKTKATKEALDILLKCSKSKGKTSDSSDKPRFNAIVKSLVFSDGYRPIPLDSGGY